MTTVEHEDFIYELVKELFTVFNIDYAKVNPRTRGARRFGSYDYEKKHHTELSTISVIISMWQEPSDGYTNQDYRAFALRIAQVASKNPLKHVKIVEYLARFPWRIAASLLSSEPGLPYVSPKNHSDTCDFYDIPKNALSTRTAKKKLERFSNAKTALRGFSGLHQHKMFNILLDQSESGHRLWYGHYKELYRKNLQRHLRRRNIYTSERIFLNLAKVAILTTDSYDDMTLREVVASEQFRKSISTEQLFNKLPKGYEKRFIERSFGTMSAPPFLFFNDFRPAPKTLTTFLHDTPVATLKKVYHYVATEHRAHPKTSTFKYAKELFATVESQGATKAYNLKDYFVETVEAKRALVLNVVKTISFTTLASYDELQYVLNSLAPDAINLSETTRRTPEEAFALLNILYDGDGRHFSHLTAPDIVNILAIIKDYRRGFAAMRTPHEFF